MYDIINKSSCLQTIATIQLVAEKAQWGHLLHNILQNLKIKRNVIEDLLTLTFLHL